ncbi:MAG: hypothetical protein SFU25_10205 [Candidatus Caenarcaniphilales bacterium]|nr:hypothetical protein [Candidatus Caenarcaniphilales bacterium]
MGYVPYKTPPEYWRLVEEKIPSSAQPDIVKSVKALGEESSKQIYKHSLKHYLWLKQAIAKDPKDLMSYQEIVSWYQTGLRDKNGKDLIQEDYKEYCRKAVELKQWDHIFYLTKSLSTSIYLLEACLETKPGEYNYGQCGCPEAARLVVGQWPKDVLHSSYLIDPAGEDFPEDFKKQERARVTALIKKHFGRDLTKEK